MSGALGSFLASGDSGVDSDVVVWDYAEKREVWRFTEHDGGVRLVCFSHDERLLLSMGAEDGRIVVWDVKTGMQVASTRMPKTAGAVTCAAWGGFVKDVKRRDTATYQFATGGDQLCLWAFDPYSGAFTVEPADSGRNVRRSLCVAFAHVPDSCGRDGYEDELLLSGTCSGDFVTYFVKPNKANPEGAPAATFASATAACGGGVASLVVDDSCEDGCVYVGGGDGTLARFMYRLSDGSWVDVEGTAVRGGVMGLAVSASGQEVLVGAASGDVVRARKGQLASPVLMCSNHCGRVTSLGFAPGSSDTFATASVDGSIRVWSADDYVVKMETTKDGAVPSSSTASAASTAGAGSELGAALDGLSLDGDKGGSRERAQGKGKGKAKCSEYATCLHFTIDAIVSGWTDGCVRSHHAGTGALLWVIKDAHAGGVSALRLSNNMRYVVTGGEQGEVRVWELRLRQLVSHLKEHTRSVSRIVLFDDDVHAISCSRDRSFLCWNLQQDKRISAHTQRMGGLNDIALNHEQTVVMTMGQERSVSLWDLREPSPILSLTRPEDGMHADEATSIAVSHGGSLFATGGMDNVVKLWSIRSGRPRLLHNNVCHTGTISGLAFSADDKQLVSVGHDGVVAIWNVFDDEEDADAESKK